MTSLLTMTQTKIKIGVTGTRSGMTDHQIQEVVKFLESLDYDVVELHHGDCVGVDVEVANIVTFMKYRSICHPPTKNDLRAHHQSDEIREPLSYFARNRNIVDETEILLVIPYQNEWQPNGGTWYTHDYAVKRGKPVKIIYPNLVDIPSETL